MKKLNAEEFVKAYLYWKNLSSRRGAYKKTKTKFDFALKSMYQYFPILKKIENGEQLGEGQQKLSEYSSVQKMIAMLDRGVVQDDTEQIETSKIEVERSGNVEQLIESFNKFQAEIFRFIDDQVENKINEKTHQKNKRIVELEAKLNKLKMESFSGVLKSKYQVKEDGTINRLHEK